ncbi:hypothetical protein PR202_ga23343 [Eleusine coracana subsp. coracana]|uniref:DUF3730 domain-containing protein n=1 Tax=Eleusine coracana subsp. coracana TaxID=191504 RepID=A0AAV5D5L2_ELECO|nr:hypothetical protein PR202_ga23343 [Eleusine coracana subsp. coracana]
MASSSAGAGAAPPGTFSRLVDRTRVPDPALQRHAVAAFFRHLLSLPAPLPAAAHDAASALLSSPHPAVAAHASISLARLAASGPDLLPPDLAFPLLLAPLAASPSFRLVSCLVKAVAALASCALRSGARFPPHDHPFVQALASGAEGARAELTRQAARMVAEGLDGVVGFLRPFVMLAVVRKGEASFARDLIGALAAAAAAAAKPGVVIPVLKLLEESLLHFGRGDGEEVRLWLSSAECLVDAYVLLLKNSLSYSLSGLEFEHEQLAGLRLLALLIEWKYEKVATSSLVSSVVSVLVLHPKLATSAAQSLATLGASNPRLGMPLFVVILFYSKILYINNNCSTKILLRLLESLPSLAIHSFVLPLALQWISPMLKRDTNPEISTSIAASIRDVCKQNPDRGVDIILSVSFCIESHDSVVQALGLESLSYLCEADVVVSHLPDFYTAWKVISKELLDYAVEPNIAHNLCALLRWGAMDAEAYSGISKELIGILWNIGTSVTSSSEPFWIKARGTAFHSLSYYKVSLIQDAIPDFWKQNYKVFTSECNVEVLKAMENFQDEIIKFEHINRRRVITDKRVAVHKFEKLLDVFPQTVFKGKLVHHQLPGAALLTLDFTPKDVLHERKSKDLPRVHAAYEQAFTEMAESIYISRNLEVALLVLHSWKSFVANWMQAVVALFDTKDSSKLNKASKAANDIFKILCGHVPATPQVAVNIALVISALCSIVPPAAHLVVSSAAEFLVRWLLQYEHEHQQWSAAVSLGLIFNCFHPTDKKSKFQVINGLLEVISKTESCLVKGACGLALGYACHGLLTGAHNAAEPEVEATTKLNERASAEDILHNLVTSLIQLCPSSSYSLKKLSICGIDSTGFIEENVNSFDDDPWAIAGLVLGLGNSVVALYRLGAYEAVTDVKNILISWIPDADSSSALFNEINSVSLCLGSCLALPAVMAFCQRVELLNDDLDMLFNRYTSLASELLNLNKSGTVFQNLLMAICIGAGSFLSCILDDGIHAMDFNGVKCLLDTFKHIYTRPFPPLVHLGAMFGVINAFGAGAGDLTGMCSKPMPSQIKHEDSSLVRGPVLTSHVGETLSTSMIQEIFLLAKDAEDKHIQDYAAWAISFLRSRWLANNQNLCDDHDSHISSGDLNQSSYFSEQSLVWNLSLWLSGLEFEKTGDLVPASTIGIVFKCLSKAPRLPTVTTDWGVTVRNAALITNAEHVDVAKRLSSGQDIWWSVLVEVVAAIYSTENSIKRQWLLDALDIGCVADHPLTALRFIGLLCGSCCIYMPLLIVNSTNVLSDLPVTLPAFLSSSIWDDNRNSIAEKLWLLTTRIYTWAEQVAQRNFLTEHDHIRGSEAEMANFLADVLRSTCIAIEDYLTVDKQLKLANLEALRS